MASPTASSRPRRDDGAAAVEFALVVPILLALIYGILGYGFMLTFRQALSQAASEGARAAATFLVTAEKGAEAQRAVNEVLTDGVSCSGTPATNGSLTGTLVRGGTTVGTCAVSAPAACAGKATATCMTVTLTYRYRDAPLVPNVPGLGLVMPSELTVSSTARVS